jgi:hypothetical protein
MDLTKAILELKENTSKLVERMATQSDKWDQQVNDLVNYGKSKIDGFIAGARGKFPLPENLIANSFMIDVDSNTGAPVGYSAQGVTIQAVHPFTKAFEGPYVAEKPANAVDDPELADADHPYWFGRYYKGPRIGRGGLADGWCGIANGHILKITAPANTTGDWKTVWFPAKRLAHVTKVGFRAWLKIVKGSRVGFGTDSGYQGIARGHIITKEEADSHPQGWMLVDIVVGTSDVVQPISTNFVVGFDHADEIEVYIALPYAYIPFGTKHMTE